jgi:hypothetical protein
MCVRTRLFLDRFSTLTLRMSKRWRGIQQKRRWLVAVPSPFRGCVACSGCRLSASPPQPSLRALIHADVYTCIFLVVMCDSNPLARSGTHNHHRTHSVSLFQASASYDNTLKLFRDDPQDWCVRPTCHVAVYFVSNACTLATLGTYMDPAPAH